MTVTRFAPSPTGDLHLGGARTALFSWLYAKHTQGKFVLRIEDTDRERSTEESTQVILEAMQWLGLHYDHGPFYQSQRDKLYHKALEALFATGKAYRCTCSPERLQALREEQMRQGKKPKYDGHCRHQQVSADVPHVVRFSMPLEGSLVFDDLIRGAIEYDHQELDDFILVRSDKSPTYNFTVVVDDHDMGITDVLRGDDHINNTPKQIHLAQALGYEPLRYGHMPSILGPDGKRLSKRHGAKSVLDYRDQGILSDALINTLARLGWSHGDQEIFSIDELITLFDLQAVQKSPAGFDESKLLWLNAQHMRQKSPSELLDLVSSFWPKQSEVNQSQKERLEKLLVLHVERSETLKDLAEKTAWYFLPLPQLDEKQGQLVCAMSESLFQDVYDGLGALGQWDEGAIKSFLDQLLSHHDLGFGRVGKPLRAIVVRGQSGVGLVDLLVLLGKDRVLSALEESRLYRQEA